MEANWSIKPEIKPEVEFLYTESKLGSAVINHCIPLQDADACISRWEVSCCLFDDFEKLKFHFEKSSKE